MHQHAFLLIQKALFTEAFLFAVAKTAYFSAGMKGDKNPRASLGEGGLLRRNCA
jgi:hypothetical protein